MKNTIFKNEMEIIGDDNLSPDYAGITWDIEVLRYESKANLRINIEQCLINTTKDNTGEPLQFEIAPENCSVITLDVDMTKDDILPVMIEIDSVTKKAIIYFGISK